MNEAKYFLKKIRNILLLAKLFCKQLFLNIQNEFRKYMFLNVLKKRDCKPIKLTFE